MNYTEQIEKQNEELQKKLAQSEKEAEEYKKLINDRRGLLVVVQDVPSSAGFYALPFVADIVLKGWSVALLNGIYNYMYPGK